MIFVNMHDKVTKLMWLMTTNSCYGYKVSYSKYAGRGQT